MATLAFPVPAVAEPQQLPRNVEAEAAMLGAMMIDNRLADDLVDKLEPGHFFEPVHGRIFAAIKTLRGNDMLVTPVTLRPMFDADEGMRELGGPAYLAGLTGSGAGLIGARQFAQQIYDLAMLRALVSVSVTSVALAGMSATVSGGWRMPFAPGGPPRPPTRFSTPSTLKLPMMPDISLPIFQVPGLSSCTSKTER